MSASLGDLLYEISTRGIILTCGQTGNRLNAKPAASLTPELAAQIREHKMEIIQIMREDELMLQSGIIESERQVFELAHEYFGLNEKGGGGGRRPSEASNKGSQQDLDEKTRRNPPETTASGR